MTLWTMLFNIAYTAVEAWWVGQWKQALQAHSRHTVAFEHQRAQRARGEAL